MLKSLFFIFLSLFYISTSYADVKGKVLNKTSEKISEFVYNIIPGNGITEVSIDFNEEAGSSPNNMLVDLEILGVRDILPKENSNLFTQFSLRLDENTDSQTTIGNLGLGYRFLNSDKSMMFGINSFYDQDFEDHHRRASVGLEAKASVLDFTFNQYQKLTNQKIIDGVKQQVLSGSEYNLASPIPYMAWTTLNVKGYRWENEKATQDSKGNIYSLEMALAPSLQLDLSRDNSSVDGVEDENSAKIIFIYPPQEKKPSLKDGVFSEAAFVKENVEDKLRDKVRRNNNLTVEIQGAVVVTRK